MRKTAALLLALLLLPFPALASGSLRTVSEAPSAQEIPEASSYTGDVRITFLGIIRITLNDP